jgi:hypothetical protein
MADKFVDAPVFVGLMPSAIFQAAQRRHNQLSK